MLSRCGHLLVSISAAVRVTEAASIAALHLDRTLSSATASARSPLNIHSIESFDAVTIHPSSQTYKSIHHSVNLAADDAGDAGSARQHTRQSQEWWLNQPFQEIASRIEEQARLRQSISLGAQKALFISCESNEHFQKALDLRAQAFKILMGSNASHKRLIQPMPIGDALQAALRLRGHKTLHALISHVSECGFRAEQQDFHQVLDAFADDAASSLQGLPTLLNTMAAHGALMTPQTCDKCVTVCLNASKPDLAAYVLQSYVKEGLPALAKSTVDRVVAAGGHVEADVLEAVNA